MVNENMYRQYGCIKDSRNVLFQYCKTISNEDLISQNAMFGRGGSMRNLLVHMAQTYLFWIGETALSKNIDYLSYENYRTIDEIIVLFDRVDKLMERFIEIPDQRLIDYKSNEKHGSATALTLFTHVITHEFHHKGQVLSISRQLGYTPIDTDIMR